MKNINQSDKLRQKGRWEKIELQSQIFVYLNMKIKFFMLYLRFIQLAMVFRNCNNSYFCLIKLEDYKGHVKHVASNHGERKARMVQNCVPLKHSVAIYSTTLKLCHCSTLNKKVHLLMLCHLRKNVASFIIVSNSF